MKKILLGCAALMCLFPDLIAQTDCEAGRYLTELFPQISIATDIEFGENVQPTLVDPDATQKLFLDVYQPLGDTLTARPLIIFAFGGGFITGQKDSPDIVELCERFAKRGYVTASIDYRLTPQLLFMPSEALAYRAVLKGTHDMRAAVRFFVKDAQTDNLFKIDPEQIIVGGVSAGGFAALHTAYLDQISEIPDAIIADTTEVGGLEGLSGNDGYPSDVIAVVNLSGALGDSAWLEPGDQPLVHAHGTNDAVVPYGSASIGLFGVSTNVDGSASIQIRADNIGVNSALLSFDGAGHVPFSSGPNSAELMDSTINFVADFLHPILCESVATNLPDEPSMQMRAFPNPVQGEFYLSPFSGNTGHLQLALIDMQGKIYQPVMVRQADRILVERGPLPPGMYQMRLTNQEGEVLLSRKLIFR